MEDKIIYDISILYVEDDLFTGKTVLQILKRRVTKVVWAKNGKEALQFFSEEHFDIIITDGTMPEMGGEELASSIRYFGSSIPIICITAHEEPDFTAKAIQAGINGILYKPIDKNKILNILHEYLPQMCK